MRGYRRRRCGDKLGKVGGTAGRCCRRPLVFGGPLESLLVARTFEPFLGAVPAPWFGLVASEL